MLLVAFTLCAAAGALAVVGTRSEGAAPEVDEVRPQQVRLGVFALSTLGVACGVLHVAAVTPTWAPPAALLGAWFGVRLLTRRDRARAHVIGAAAVGAAGVAAGVLLAELA